MKWVHDTFPEPRLFGWQEEYGAFSVSVSQSDKICEYINGQAEHHRTMTLQEEFLALLKKHRIEYDERYLWERISAVPAGLARFGHRTRR